MSKLLTFDYSANLKVKLALLQVAILFFHLITSFHLFLRPSFLGLSITTASTTPFGGN